MSGWGCCCCRSVGGACCVAGLHATPPGTGAGGCSRIEPTHPHTQPPTPPPTRPQGGQEAGGARAAPRAWRAAPPPPRRRPGPHCGRHGRHVWRADERLHPWRWHVHYWRPPARHGRHGRLRGVSRSRLLREQGRAVRAGRTRGCASCCGRAPQCSRLAAWLTRSSPARVQAGELRPGQRQLGRRRPRWRPRRWAAPAAMCVGRAASHGCSAPRFAHCGQAPIHASLLSMWPQLTHPLRLCSYTAADDSDDDALSISSVDSDEYERQQERMFM